jgi:hypothetical protein
MIGTLTLAAAMSLAPMQPGQLNLINARTTYGELGPPRTDNNYLPSDLYFLSFDIDGIKTSPEGKVAFTMSMVVTDKNNKEVYKPERPAEREELYPLGGNRLPGRVFVALKPDQEPGTYTCKVTVTDKVSNSSKTLEQPFQVIPKAFGLVFLYLTSDPDGTQPAPPSGVVGQNLFVHCNLVGFGRGADKKPNAKVELQIFDEANKPTVAKPFTAEVPKEAPDGDPVIFRFPIPFNREGNFTAKITATDSASTKTSTISFPIKVTAK